MLLRKVSFIIIMLFAMSVAKAQMLAVNTDVAMDGLMAPNLGLELTVGNQSTLSLNGLISHKPWGKTAQVAALQPEYRYYLSGRPMDRFFLGLGGIAAVYDVNIKDKRYDGYCAGGGLTFGYVLPLTERLSVDFHAGFGVTRYKQKEYYLGDDFDNEYSLDGNQRSNASGFRYMPTRIGVSLSYTLR